MILSPFPLWVIILGPILSIISLFVQLTRLANMASSKEVIIRILKTHIFSMSKLMLISSLAWSFLSICADFFQGRSATEPLEKTIYGNTGYFSEMGGLTVFAIILMFIAGIFILTFVIQCLFPRLLKCANCNKTRIKINQVTIRQRSKITNGISNEYYYPAGQRWHYECEACHHTGFIDFLGNEINKNS
jgi:hypothetical protein